MHKCLALIPLPILLAACGAAGTRPISAPPPRPGVAVPATRPAPPPAQPRRNPQVLRAPGLEGVIGASANALIAAFGPPRLDVREGDARKLQFAGTACVLDVFLYPGEANAEATATYLDARRASDGLDVDRASCIQALKQR